MILNDCVRELITTMDVFMTKKGHDSEVSKQIVNLINEMNGEDSLDKIYVNEVDNFNIPDVVVLPLYNRNFNTFFIRITPEKRRAARPFLGERRSHMCLANYFSSSSACWQSSSALSRQ